MTTPVFLRMPFTRYPRFAKIFRDIWENKGRSALVILSIAIGAFAAGVIISSKAIISKGLNGEYLATNPTHAIIYTSPISEDALGTVRSMRNVADAEGRRRLSVRVVDGNGKPGARMDLYAIKDFRGQGISMIKRDSGPWPPPRNSVLLERATLGSNGGLTVGGRIQVELPDGKHKYLRIAGKAHDISAMPPMFQGSGEGFVTPDTMEKLGQPRQMNEIYVVFKGIKVDKQTLRAEAEKVRNHLKKAGVPTWGVYVPDPGEHPASFILNAFMVILGSLGLLSLFLGGFLVVNTISALLMQQMRQIGMMRAVGASISQIQALYLTMVVILGFAAFLVAWPTGILATRAFTGWTGTMLNYTPDPGGFTPLGLGLQAVVCLLVPLFASAWPIRSGTRVTAREALSFTGIHEDHTTLRMARATARTAHALSLSRPASLALRNTFRRRGRLLLTLITLSIGGGVFIGVMTVRSSLLATMDDAFKYWNYNVSINLGGKYPTERIMSAVMSTKGVTDAEAWNYSRGQRIRKDGTRSNSYFIAALPARTKMISPKVISGRWLLPGDESAVVLNSAVMRSEKDLKPGMRTNLEISGKKRPFTVVGIVRSVMTGPVIYVNQPYLAGLIGESGRARSVNVAAAQSGTAYEEELAEKLRASIQASGMKYDSTDEVTSRTKIQISKQFDLIVVILLVMAALITAVGSLGLTGTMGMNVIERIKEIGVMRAIGADDKTVVRIFLLEGVVVGILGWAISSIVAIPIGMALSSAVGNNFMNASLTYRYSWGGLGSWLVLSSLLAALSSWIPSHKASQISVRDVLAYE